MSVTIGIIKEKEKYENRVALSPDTAKKLIALGASVQIQSKAGDNADFNDTDYKDAGAKIVKTSDDVAKNADILLCVQPPEDKIVKSLKKDALLIGVLGPYQNDALLKLCASQKLQSFSMELMPRITRAQSMDVLSSQANLTGYKAILDACEHFSRAMPMMMTAAGTIPPAKVFAMGAGVAGLQAIATAKRLGGVVTATDVRPAAKEQVESLGGTFVAVEDDEFKEAETAGGYAKEMSKEYQKKQAELVEKHIAKQDIVITTALIPGRPAPKLITDSMIKSMPSGSVIVDLAVENGGNVAGSKAGSVVEKHGVKIIGHINVASRLSRDASALYAKNLYNFVALLIDDEKKEIAIDWDDEIIQGTALTKDGKIIHPNFSKQKAKPKATKEKKGENDNTKDDKKNDTKDKKAGE